MTVSKLVDIAYNSNRIMSYLRMGDLALAMCYMNIELRKQGAKEKHHFADVDDMQALASIVC